MRATDAWQFVLATNDRGRLHRLVTAEAGVRVRRILIGNVLASTKARPRAVQTFPADERRRRWRGGCASAGHLAIIAAAGRPRMVRHMVLESAQPVKSRTAY
jgi:hypothetical protein